jgi:hypothetical protein
MYLTATFPSGILPKYSVSSGEIETICESPFDMKITEKKSIRQKEKKIPDIFILTSSTLNIADNQLPIDEKSRFIFPSFFNQRIDGAVSSLRRYHSRQMRKFYDFLIR